MKFKNQPWDEPGLDPLQRMVRFNKMSVREFASQFGVSYNSAALILAGQYPKLPVTIAIARYFQVTVEDIWGHELDSSARRPVFNRSLISGGRVVKLR